MREQQQSGNDGSFDFLWIMALVIGAALLIWYFGRGQITAGVFFVRSYEIIAVDFVYGLFAKFLQMIGFGISPATGLEELLIYMRNSVGAKVDFSSLVSISTTVGNYTRYPLGLLMLGGSIWLYLGSASHQFRHTYSTKLLESLEQTNWPQITPVVNLDLVNTQLDQGPWAIGLSPMRFCKKYDLLNITEKNGGYSVTLKRGCAQRLLSLQVGPRWKGVQYLPDYLKALFAIFAAKINGDKKGSEAMLDQISATATSDTAIPDFSGVEQLLNKYSNTKKVVAIVNAHSYVTTVFASLLIGAREAGVLASAEFIWLKPRDRRMWFMLNTVGRPTALPEICGAFAHWLAERKLGLPLTVPMVDEAVTGLEIALSELIYKPEEED